MNLINLDQIANLYILSHEWIYSLWWNWNFVDNFPWSIIGIDLDTVCAGVVYTAIRHSTSCAGRRAATCGRAACTMSAVLYCSTNHDSADRISGQFLYYHDHNFTKSKGNFFRFRRLLLFVPIGVCVTTHDDETASDVTIGMWHHNQQATNYERNSNPWFSLPK